METKKIIQIGLGIVFLGLVLVAAYFFLTSGGAAGEYKGFIYASGRIEGDEYNAAPKAAGKVQQILVNEGDTVKKGQLLAVLYSSQLQAQMDSARADLAVARNRLTQAESALDQAIGRSGATITQAQANLGVNASQLDKARASLTQALIAVEQSRAQVNQRELEYQQAIANRDKARANLTYNEKEYQRFKNLVAEDAVARSKFEAVETLYLTSRAEYTLADREVEKARITFQNSKKDLEVARASVTVARAAVGEAENQVRAGGAGVALARTGTQDVRQREEDVRSARAELAKAEDQLASATADLNDSRVYAPTDGRVVGKIIQVGEVISGGTPIITIVNMNDLYLRVFLSTINAGKVEIGQEARIFPDAFPHESFIAAVTRVAGRAEFTPKNVDTKDQRSKLVFEIRLKCKDNSAGKLKPGMTADAYIRIDSNTSWDQVKPK